MMLATIALLLGTFPHSPAVPPSPPRPPVRRDATAERFLFRWVTALRRVANPGCAAIVRDQALEREAVAKLTYIAHLANWNSLADHSMDGDGPPAYAFLCQTWHRIDDPAWSVKAILRRLDRPCRQYGEDISLLDGVTDQNAFSNPSDPPAIQEREELLYRTRPTGTPVDVQVLMAGWGRSRHGHYQDILGIAWNPRTKTWRCRQTTRVAIALCHLPYRGSGGTEHDLTAAIFISYQPSLSRRRVR